MLTDFHIPSLAENRSLVTTFRGLKTEMSLMREQMQTILSHRDALSFHYPANLLATTFCPAQPLDVAYKLDRFGSINDSPLFIILLLLLLLFF